MAAVAIRSVVIGVSNFAKAPRFRSPRGFRFGGMPGVIAVPSVPLGIVQASGAVMSTTVRTILEAERELRVGFQSKPGRSAGGSPPSA